MKRESIKEIDNRFNKMFEGLSDLSGIERRKRLIDIAKFKIDSLIEDGIDESVIFILQRSLLGTSKFKKRGIFPVEKIIDAIDVISKYETNKEILKKFNKKEENM